MTYPTSRISPFMSAWLNTRSHHTLAGLLTRISTLLSRVESRPPPKQQSPATRTLLGTHSASPVMHADAPRASPDNTPLAHLRMRVAHVQAHKPLVRTFR